MPLYIVRQDITLMQVDAIVNTTNEEMKGFSGVDYAVHKKAGKKLDKACERLRPLGLGEVKLTKGYDLPARYIIHTSGPVWQGGTEGEEYILRSCYERSLQKATEKRLKTIAFPLISAGVYGYPKDKVLKFAVQIVSEFLNDHELTVYLCVYDKTSYEFSRTLYGEISDFIHGDSEEGYCQNPDTASRRLQQECSVASFAPVCSDAEEFIQADCCSYAPSAPSARMAEPKQKTVKKSTPEKNKSLQEYMRTMDKSFAYKLFDYIDASGLTDVQCYKRANVDKKTFSKIKCNPDTYKPSKQTAVAFAIALKLNINETQELLASAGLTLSDSFIFDKIIRYFIMRENYDIFEINEALFEFDQMLLGCH
ncbi:MAG: macro domain-containing protein [Clostridia bacterium]|nr:macro domain-containing protein [Clostridia bacterium]